MTDRLGPDTPSCRERYTCRACEGTDLASVLDLGFQPLANRFLTDDQLDEPEPEYRLHLVRCLTCSLVQLTHVVDPIILYGPSYPYRSGYSEGWRDHCCELAKELAKKKVLDIGCLDGVLLSECAKLNCDIHGCDPSSAQPPAIRQLFGRDTRLGQFDAIVAQNVFGHVDDAKGFLEGVAANLAPYGVCIIECPWVVPMICEGRWDTVYHEHVTTWGFGGLYQARQGTGLHLTDARYFPDLHGGTMRYYLYHGNSATVTSSMAWAMLAEQEGVKADDYVRFAIRSYGDIKRWEKYFENVNGKAIAAYGASAKLNTWLNALRTRPPIVGVFDDNPAKQNLYTPGCHYPVLVPTKMTLRETDVLLVPGNWKGEIEAKARALGFAGEVKSLW